MKEIEFRRLAGANVAGGCWNPDYRMRFVCCRSRIRGNHHACKNLGTTHITNGCYRPHPVEWNVGEVAGMLAANCIRHRQTPGKIHDRPDRVLDLQRRLVERGVPIFWYADVGLDAADFQQAQLAPFTDPAELERTVKTLNYRAQPPSGR